MNECIYCGSPCSRKACSDPECKRKLKNEWQNKHRSPAPNGRKCKSCDTIVFGKARQCSACREKNKLRKCKRCRVEKVESRRSSYCKECKRLNNLEAAHYHNNIRRFKIKEKERLCEDCKVVSLKGYGNAKNLCKECAEKKRVERNRTKSGKAQIPDWALSRGAIRYDGYSNL